MLMSCLSFAVAEEETAVAVETAEAVSATPTDLPEEDEPVADEPVDDEPVADEPLDGEPADDEPELSDEDAYAVGDITAIDCIWHDDIHITIEYCDDGNWREASWDDRLDDVEAIKQKVRVNISILSRNGALAHTDSDYENIQVRLSDSHGWAGACYVKLKEFTEETKDNGEVVYSKTLPYPSNLIVFGPLDLDVRVDDTVSGKVSDWNDASGIVCTKAPEVTVRVDGTTVYVDTSFLHGANVLISDIYLMQWDEASQAYKDVASVHEPWDGNTVFRNVSVGDRYIVKATQLYQGMEAGQFSVDGWSEELQVLDWTVAPTVSLTQTAAGQVNLNIDGNAATYAVEYAVDDGKATTVSCKKGDNTLKKLGSSGTLSVKVRPTADGQTSSNTATASWKLVSWDWAKAPTVTATQDLTAEGKLKLTFSDYAYPAYLADGEGLEIGYTVTANGRELEYTVSEVDGEYVLVRNGAVAGSRSGSLWVLDVDYEAGTGKDTVKVRPFLVFRDDDGNRLGSASGTVGSVKYNRTAFIAAAWKLAPKVSTPRVVLNTAVFDVYLRGGAETGMISIDGKKYALSGPGVDFITAASVEGYTQVTVTFGGDLAYGKHKFAFAAVGSDGTAGTYSSAVAVTVSATPAWASGKLTLKVSQVNDTSVKLTFTRLADTTGSLTHYQVFMNGEELCRVAPDSNQLSVDAKGKNYILTFQLPDGLISYQGATTFTVRAIGSYEGTGAVDFKTSTAKASLTLKQLWKTAPTAKASVSSVLRQATVTVTGKGSPTGYSVQFSTDKGKTWTDLDAASLPYGAYLTLDSFSGAKAIYTLTASENFSAAVQFRFRPVKADAEGEAVGSWSDGVSVKLAPAWTTTVLKPTATQTGEGEVTVSWKALTGAEMYCVCITDSADYAADFFTETARLTVTGLTAGKTYKITVQPQSTTGTYIEGTTSKAVSVAVKALWSKKPVVKVTKVTGVSVTASVTYYGKPDASLVLAITGPNGYAAEQSVASPADAGTSGKKVTFTFEVSNNGAYAPGTYTLKATVKNGEGSVTSKAVTAAVKDSALENNAKLKSLTQVNERKAKLTLSKAIGTAGDDRYLVVTAVQEGVDEPLYQSGHLALSKKSFVLDFGETTPDYSKVTILLQTYVDDGSGTYVEGNTCRIAAGKYLKGTYWKTKPAFTVVQSGSRALRLQMTGGTAAEYQIAVTGADNCSGIYYVSQGGTVEMDLSSVGGYGAGEQMTVAVMPYVDGAPAEDLTVKKTVTWKASWDTVSGVTAAAVKGTDYVTVSYSCLSMADGVYVEFCDPSTGVSKLTVKVSSADISFSVGKKSITAILSVQARPAGKDKLTGKYIVKVTPYLDYDDVTASEIHGDSAKASAKLTLK